MTKKVKDYCIITLGAVIMAFAIEMFYYPKEIVTGGFSGLSIILNQILSGHFGIFAPIWLINTILNVPLFFVSLKIMGRNFAVKAGYGTLVLSVGLYFMEFLPKIETDFVITAVFGGVLSGLGLGLVFSRSGSTGGTDLLANIIHKVNPTTSVAHFLFVIDTAVIIIGMFIFGAEKAMYAIIAVYADTRMIDYVIEGLHFSKAAFIVSDKSKEIADKILHDLDRGATSLDGHGAYSGKDKNVLLCVVSRKEIVRLRKLVSRVDEHAFVIVTDVREVLGEGFQHL
ncbi:membrane protein [Clostridia bacterium]|nr:membrane protein [Clostridia bacterium]